LLETLRGLLALDRAAEGRTGLERQRGRGVELLPPRGLVGPSR
jgi:hypothetical protein